MTRLTGFLALVAVCLSALPLSGETPKLQWQHATPGALPMAVAVDTAGRPFIYAALKNGGLAVLEVRKSGPPREVQRIAGKSIQQLDVTNFVQRGRTLYLSLGGHFARSGTRHAGLGVVDVRDPAQPKVKAVWKSAEPIKGAAAIATDGKTAYLAVMSEGVFVFDVSQPTRVRKIGEFLPDIHFPRKNPGRVQFPNARGLVLRHDQLFVAYDAGGLRVLDVSTPSRPREVGRYINAVMGNKQQAYNNLVLDGDLAYIAIDYAGMEVVDVTNPGSMKQVGWWNSWDAHTLKNLWFNSPGHTNQIVHDKQRRLVYLSAGDSELQVVDISNPRQPKLAKTFGEPKNKLGVWGVGLSKEHVLLAYIRTFVPFQGTWSGIKAVNR